MKNFNVTWNNSIITRGTRGLINNDNLILIYDISQNINTSRDFDFLGNKNIFIFNNNNIVFHYFDYLKPSLKTLNLIYSQIKTQAYE